MIFFLVAVIYARILNSDYPAQYNNNRNPSQPKYVQTTYRPSTTLTTQTQSTSTKNILQPQRETYIANSKPNYDQTPTHEAYNPDYDEALVAQVFMHFFLYFQKKKIFAKKFNQGF